MTLSVRDMFDVAGEAPQGDVFAQFGEQQAPAHVGHSSNRYAKKHDADLSPLEQKLRERQRLSAAYLHYRSQRRKDLLEQEPRLRAFAKYLRSIPKCGDDLPEVLCSSWLAEAPRDVRLMALELVTRRCDQINRSLGYQALDDPMPTCLGGWEDMRSRCAAILYPAGRH